MKKLSNRAAKAIEEKYNVYAIAARYGYAYNSSTSEIYGWQFVTPEMAAGVD